MLLGLLPILAVFIFMFMYLIKQKRSIIHHVKYNEDLRKQFLESLNRPTQKDAESLSSADVDELFEEIFEKDSANDFLTPDNFCGSHSKPS